MKVQISSVGCLMIEIEIDMDSNDKKHNYFYGYLTNICQIHTI